MRTEFLGLILIVSLDTGTGVGNSSCGWDGSPVSTVYEGVASISTYPWLGMLYYPMAKKRFTTSVVLVTRQMVIAAASEIDKLPKNDFRAKARVVLGHRCGEGTEIKVRDYTFHPEYVKDSYSALAVLQLETDHVKTELRPICQPPAHFIQPQFYAMTLTENCKNPKVRIHRMKYVDINECRTFYRRFGLNQDSLWPRHAACARAVSGGRCVWRSGSVLAVKQDGRWRLLGFSVYGPGCGDPARFLDYGRYHSWVRLSSATAGLPAVTRVRDNHLVMRRSLSNIQRYGKCDDEERTTEIYSDTVTILHAGYRSRARYNVSLYANVEYSCITFNARPITSADYVTLNITEPKNLKYGNAVTKAQPKIRLRRWCATSTGMCHGFQFIEIQFYVAIEFSQSIQFTAQMYGKEAKIISANAAMKYNNVHQSFPATLEYLEVLELLKNQSTSVKEELKNKWFKPK